jgi:hypothetical protein
MGMVSKFLDAFTLNAFMSGLVFSFLVPSAVGKTGAISSLNL